MLVIWNTHREQTDGYLGEAGDEDEHKLAEITPSDRSKKLRKSQIVCMPSSPTLELLDVKGSGDSSAQLSYCQRRMF